MWLTKPEPFTIPPHDGAYIRLHTHYESAGERGLPASNAGWVSIKHMARSIDFFAILRPVYFQRIIGNPACCAEQNPLLSTAGGTILMYDDRFLVYCSIPGYMRGRHRYLHSSYCGLKCQPSLVFEEKQQ